MASTVKKNVVANFIGNGWTAILAVILIPVYIKFLGVEAWGVVGIFTTLQNLAYLSDLGLSYTLNREMARLSLDTNNGQEMRDLVRTLELIYWAMAAILGIVVFGVAPLIAHHWVHAEQLSPSTIQNAIRLMGLALFLQTSITLYLGGLMGLQRQVLLSSISVVSGTVRSVGAVVILWKISPTLQAFFLWQVLTGLLQAVITRWFLWRSIPRGQSAPRFRSSLLRRSWRFAAGMSAVTTLSLILTQMDKVLLSRLLSLEAFGYYALASSVATSLYLFTLPVFSALYPRFTQLASLGDEEGLSEIYHDGCQLMSALILPVAGMVAFFSEELMLLWTGNQTTASRTHVLVTILIVGTALNALLYLPHALQISHGWVKLSFYVNLILVLISAPLIALTASIYGAAGAALTFVCLTASVALVLVYFMHGRILKGQQWRWYFKDVGWPLLVSICAAFVCRVFVPTEIPRLQMLFTLASVSLFVSVVTVLATPVTRKALIGLFRSWHGRLIKTS